MMNDSKPKALTFWEAQDHLSAVKVGLATIVPSKYKNHTHFSEVFLNLSYALYSASEASLFNEFKRIFSKYMAITSMRDDEPPVGYHNHAILMQHNLLATIFQYYENVCSIDEVQAAEALLVKFTARTSNPLSFEEHNEKILRMSRLIHTGKHAYFVVSFKLPFALPIPDGKYEVWSPSGKSTIAVEGFTANDVSSRVADRHFSRVNVTIRGFTCTDSYWGGPDIKGEHQEPRNSRLALSVVNRVVLEAKLVDESLRLVVASQCDIGQVVTKQHDGEGNVFHQSIGLTFGGLSMVDVLSRQQVTSDQSQLLSKKLSSKVMAMHENLYAQVLIQRDAENSVGAYYLLNSATEAMIDHFLIFLFEKTEASNKLQGFLQGESICTTCELFKASPSVVNPPRSANPPSPFQRLKFLQEVGIVESSEVRRLQKLLAMVRNDDMRNDLSHGRKGDIPLIAVDNAIKAFRELKSAFLAME